MLTTLLYLFCVFFLLLVLMLAYKGLSYKYTSPYLFSDREDSSSYECGFEHNSLSRIPFSVRYFMLTLVFLIFDLEIVLLLISPFSLLLLPSFSLPFLLSFSFIFILFLGLIYEWLDGSLNWVM